MLNFGSWFGVGEIMLLFELGVDSSVSRIECCHYGREPRTSVVQFESDCGSVGDRVVRLSIESRNSVRYV